MTVKRIAMTIVVIGTFAFTGYAITVDALSNIPEQSSWVTIKGSTRIYGKWACKGIASVEAMPGEALEAVPGFTGGLQVVETAVPIADIECDDRLVKKKLRKTLKEENTPRFTSNCENTP